MSDISSAPTTISNVIHAFSTAQSSADLDSAESLLAELPRTERLKAVSAARAAVARIEGHTRPAHPARRGDAPTIDQVRAAFNAVQSPAQLRAAERLACRLTPHDQLEVVSAIRAADARLAQLDGSKVARG